MANASNCPCRLCGKCGTQKIHIFGDVGQTFDLPNLIAKHLPLIHLKPTSTTPTFCCTICSDTLIAWDRFVIHCSRTEQQLLGVKDKKRVNATMDEDFAMVMEMCDGVEHRNRNQERSPIAYILEMDTNQCDEDTLNKLVTTPIVRIDIVCDMGADKVVAIELDDTERSTKDSDSVRDSNTHDESGQKPVEAWKPAATCRRKSVRLANSARKLEPDGVKKSDRVNAEHTFERLETMAKRLRERDRDHARVTKTFVDGRVYYECTACPKRLFTLQRHCKQHLIVHDKVRPHKCTTCGKGFLFKSRLDRHTQIYSNPKPFPCGICCVSFKLNRYRRRHVRRIHGGDERKKEVD